MGKYTCYSFESHNKNYRKKYIRAITFSHYLEPSQPLFNQINILYFFKLVIPRISLMMFKQHNGIDPTPIAKLFELNNLHHNYNTRQNIKLHTQIGNRESVYKLFSFQGINIWNHLSSKFQQLCHMHVLKIE